MGNDKRFLAIWDCIHIMNTAGIFTYGIAANGRTGPVIRFENLEQVRLYDLVFEPTEEKR